MTKTISTLAAKAAGLALFAALLMPLLAMSGCGPATGKDPASGADPVLPETRRETITETIHGTVVHDPYRWLENYDDPQVRAWLAAHDDVARAALASRGGRDEIKSRLEKIAYYDSVSTPTKRGGRLFYARRDEKAEKAIHYYRDADGAEHVLLDPNAMSADGSISIGVVVPDHAGRRVAYARRENNADAAILYVRDIESGRDSAVDVIEGAKYASPQWVPDGSGFYYTALPTDDSIPIDVLPGEAQIKYHALGADPAHDEVLFDKTGDPTRFLTVDLSRDGRWLVVYDLHGWSSSDVYVKDLSRPGGRFETLVAGLPAIFLVEPHGDSLFVQTNWNAPNWRVMRARLGDAGPESWREVVAERDDAAMSDDGGMSLFGGHLVLSYLENASSRVMIHRLDGALVRELDLPDIGSIGSISGRADEDEIYFSFSSFTSPTKIYRSSVASAGLTVWSEVEVAIDADRFTTDQVWYESKDGTRISMFIVRAKDVDASTPRPTLLYGYGGFNVALTPSFKPLVYPWLESGGIYAVPNLRGGSEYGEEWHRAGMLTQKQNVFDDFVAAAEWLIERGWTEPETLAIYGRSNGGLLVGAAMTQRPDLYRAVVCGVPLLDMVRYHLFGSGRTWISEYGSADDAGQFAALHAYSPYHRVTRGTDYPALLMLSTDSDDRVDPMHARKFVAAVQHAQTGAAPILLRVEKNAGHGGADLVKSDVAKWTDMYTFLNWHLGLD